MVAIALPQPARQLSFLEAPNIARFDVIRLSRQLSRMFFDDALLCGDYALERLDVTDSYVQFVLYYRDWVIGVVEVRGRLAEVRRELARLLLTKYEWQVDAVKFVRYGAITPEHFKFERTARLLRGDS
jgi:hypothetical protein